MAFNQLRLLCISIVISLISLCCIVPVSAAATSQSVVNTYVEICKSRLISNAQRNPESANASSASKDMDACMNEFLSDSSGSSSKSGGGMGVVIIAVIFFLLIGVFFYLKLTDGNDSLSKGKGNTGNGRREFEAFKASIQEMDGDEKKKSEPKLNTINELLHIRSEDFEIPFLYFTYDKNEERYIVNKANSFSELINQFSQLTKKQLGDIVKHEMTMKKARERMANESH